MGMLYLNRRHTHSHSYTNHKIIYMRKILLFIGAFLLTVQSVQSQDMLHDGIAYNLLATGELEVTALPNGQKYSGDIQIPYSVTIGEEGPVTRADGGKSEEGSEIMEYRVIRIGDRAFKDCTELTKLQMPMSLEEIGVEAVAGCTSLIEVTMPTNLRKICDRAFEGSQLGASFTISEGLDEMGDLVFHNAKATDIIIGGCELTAFGKETFTGSTVERILLPSRLKSIPEETFRDCTSLSYVGFGDCLEEIEDNAFRGCVSLKALSLPGDIAKIGHDAFAAVEVKSVSFGGTEAPKYSIESICGGSMPSLVAFPAMAELSYKDWCPAMFEKKSTILVGGDYASHLSKWVYPGAVSENELPSVVGYGVTSYDYGEMLVLADNGGDVSMCFPNTYGGDYDIMVNDENVATETVFAELDNFYLQNPATSFVGDSKLLTLENLRGDYVVDLNDSGSVSVKAIDAESNHISYDPGRNVVAAPDRLITVYDINGKCVARGNSLLSTSGLASGLYMVVTIGGVRKILVR